MKSHKSVNFHAKLSSLQRKFEIIHIQRRNEMYVNKVRSYAAIERQKHRGDFRRRDEKRKSVRGGEKK
jgi:hypothetical protein